MGSLYPRQIHCLIPVHNRVEVTRRCLEQLRDQLCGSLTVIVVDDGSTDDTSAMLAAFDGLKLTVLRGDGSLWWGGAVSFGMRYLADAAGSDDALLLLNDDVALPGDFLARFIDAARAAGPRALIGCRQEDLETGRGPHYGYRLDRRRYRIELLTDVPVAQVPFPVDALPGRGMLVPWAVVNAIGPIDAARFPHYWGDIEFSARARERGFGVLCDPRIAVGTSFAASDSKRTCMGFYARYFSPTSSLNVVQRARFWALRGPEPRPVSGFLRYALAQAVRGLAALRGRERRRA